MEYKNNTTRDGVEFKHYLDLHLISILGLKLIKY